MYKSLKISVLIFAIILAFQLTKIEPQDHGSCKNISNAVDNTLWEVFRDNNKNYYKQFFNIPTDQWNEGWGVSTQDPSYAFPKMLNACNLLQFGLKDGLDFWTQTRIGHTKIIRTRTMEDTLLYPNGPYEPSDPVMIPTSDNMVHTFIRNGYGELLHYYYNPETHNAVIYPNQEIITRNIIGGSTDPDTPVNAGHGSFKILDDMGTNIQVFMVAGRWANDPQTNWDDGSIILYKQSGANPIGNWSQNVITPQVGPQNEFGVIHDLAIVKEKSGIIHIFAKSKINYQLVHYQLPPNGNPTVTIIGSQDPQFAILRSPVAIIDDEGEIHVFTRTIYGLIGHYYQDSQKMWIRENLTQRLNTNILLAYTPKHELVIANGVKCNRIDLFAEASSGDLVNISREKVGGKENWTIENITHSLPSSDSYHMSEGIKYIENPKGVQHLFGIFPLGAAVNNYRSHLIHYYHFGDYIWKADNPTLLTAEESFYFIKKRIFRTPNPIERNVGNSNIVLFSVNDENRPLEYIWSSTESSDAGWWHSSFIIRQANTLLKLNPMKICAATITPNNREYFVALDSSNTFLIHHRRAECFAWHTNEDYSNWASGYLHGFRYQPKQDWRNDEGNIVYGKAYAGWFRTNRVEMWCPIFNQEVNRPGLRAAVMLHEATHIIFADEVDVWGHWKLNNRDVDWWIHHKLSDIPRGGLDPAISEQRHSMYQIEVEFLADLSQFADWWVPYEVFSGAKSTANQLISTRFINEVGWSVGVPRPL